VRGGSSVGTGRLEQPATQLALAVHGAAHQDVVTLDFVEEYVLLEWAEDDKEAPPAQTRMSKAGAWSKLRMFCEEFAGGLDSFQVAICYFPTCLDQIPLELMLDIDDKEARFADTHERFDVRARTRLRISLKSLFVSGVVGLSAASSSQASTSGVTSKGLCC
jgi:hypothetical protein